MVSGFRGINVPQLSYPSFAPPPEDQALAITGANIAQGLQTGFQRQDKLTDLASQRSYDESKLQEQRGFDAQKLAEQRAYDDKKAQEQQQAFADAYSPIEQGFSTGTPTQFTTPNGGFTMPAPTATYQTGAEQNRAIAGIPTSVSEKLFTKPKIRTTRNVLGPDGQPQIVTYEDGMEIGREGQYIQPQRELQPQRDQIIKHTGLKREGFPGTWTFTENQTKGTGEWREEAVKPPSDGDGKDKRQMSESARANLLASAKKILETAKKNPNWIGRVDAPIGAIGEAIGFNSAEQDAFRGDTERFKSEFYSASKNGHLKQAYIDLQKFIPPLKTSQQDFVSKMDALIKGLEAKDAGTPAGGVATIPTVINGKTFNLPK